MTFDSNNYRALMRRRAEEALKQYSFQVGTNYHLPDGSFHFPWGIVQLDVYRHYLRIMAIWVRPECRGEGHATSQMDLLCRAAERYNATMQLQCRPFMAGDSPSKPRLIKWYESFGFVRATKGDINTLLRVCIKR